MSSSTGLNGFRRTASAPEVRSRSPSMSAPVSKITWGERAERLSSRQNESPSSPGRLTSRITTSGRKNRAISAAASAESASSTSNSLAGSVVRRSSRRPASSSTTRTRSRSGSGAVTAAIGGDLRGRLKAAALSALARSARSTPPAPDDRSDDQPDEHRDDEPEHDTDENPRRPTRHLAAAPLAVADSRRSRGEPQRITALSVWPLTRRARGKPLDRGTRRVVQRLESEFFTDDAGTSDHRLELAERNLARADTSSRSRARARVSPAAAP